MLKAIPLMNYVVNLHSIGFNQKPLNPRMTLSLSLAQIGSFE
jgi:hypothetical protein